MPRARNIKHSFFMDDELSELDPLARLLFIGLWTLADREGRLYDKPARIKVQVLPYDDCVVDTLLNDLAGICNPDGTPAHVVRYKVGGVECLQIVNFTKHQYPHRNENQSTIPPIPECDGTTSDSIESAPDKISTNPARS